MIYNVFVTGKLICLGLIRIPDGIEPDEAASKFHGMKVRTYPADEDGVKLSRLFGGYIADYHA